MLRAKVPGHKCLVVEVKNGAGERFSVLRVGIPDFRIGDFRRPEGQKSLFACRKVSSQGRWVVAWLGCSKTCKFTSPLREFATWRHDSPLTRFPRYPQRRD